eukprot:TRINITY_DN57647_c0_g1_i2.p1 TRINITY_DN57647_c0_g1~~TRINITY_DN57647_c0_g1_i2.p1  ORF type:complete len:345 (-),score=58.22 TRINITY_DN57647_c0_g1_i2:143-1177(-)
MESDVVKGYDFNKGLDYGKLFESYRFCGIQATNMAYAIDEINKMIKWRLVDEPIKEDEDEELRKPEARSKVRATIFLGYTSNMISCGMREILRYLCEHKMVDCIVTTAGGIEEDFMKCLADSYIGDFHLKGSSLRDAGINRIGNMLVPNNNYCLLEDWLMPLVDKMYVEQKEKGTIFSPSLIIDRLGEAINNKDSVYYWCHKNKIPVFCPALTDGSIGDMLFFYTYKHDDFIVDILSDLRKLNKISMSAKKTGMIILGGGIIKHHICNANLMRNGADYSVYINTGIEYDASDAGASPDEAVSWGKISSGCKPVKIFAEASLVFPVIVAETFVKHKDLALSLIHI